MCLCHGASRVTDCHFSFSLVDRNILLNYLNVATALSYVIVICFSHRYSGSYCMDGGVVVLLMQEKSTSDF